MDICIKYYTYIGKKLMIQWKYTEKLCKTPLVFNFASVVVKLHCF